VLDNGTCSWVCHCPTAANCQQPAGDLTLACQCPPRRINDFLMQNYFSPNFYLLLSILHHPVFLKHLSKSSQTRLRMTRIIIKRKLRSSSPTPSPLIPSSPASSTTAPSPSHTPITRSATKNQVRLYCGSKECPICKVIIVNRNNALKRHVERHVTLAELEVQTHYIPSCNLY